MTAFRMTKKLPAITTQPYGVFVSEQKERGRYLIHLVKLTKVDFKEGDRLSENGLINQDADVLKLSDRVGLALSLLELVEGDNPKAFDYLKGALIGEQEISVTTKCTACDFDFPDEDCEVCGGEVEYQQEYPITWTDQKDTLSLAFSELLSVARGKTSE